MSKEMFAVLEINIFAVLSESKIFQLWSALSNHVYIHIYLLLCVYKIHLLQRGLLLTALNSHSNNSTTNFNSCLSGN